MSITAFPVWQDRTRRGFIRQNGAIVITCAAADDITAWCLLAVVIAIVKAGDFIGSLYVIRLLWFMYFA
jgi:Kef-type K+ transport system membrane component KefB